MALIVAHPSYKPELLMHMPTAQTPDSIAAAKRAQRTEQARAVAQILASVHDVNFTGADAATRGHFLAIADAAMQAAGSAKGLSL